MLSSAVGDYRVKVHSGKCSAWYMKIIWKLQCQSADAKIDRLTGLHNCGSFCFVEQTDLLSIFLPSVQIYVIKFSNNHCNHYLWFVTQSYSAIPPKKLRRHAKSIFVWYPKEWTDIKMVHDQINVLTDDDQFIVRDCLKTSNMHVCT